MTRHDLAERKDMKWITKLRLEQGLSQAKLAQRAETHPSCISRIESGKEETRGARGYRLAKALGWTGKPEALSEEVEHDG